MPIYYYSHPQTGKVIAVFQKMTDCHECFGPDGLKWNREWTVPNAATDSTAKLNPFDSKEFVRKSATKKGTLGDLFDASQELSEKRTRLAGKDALAESYPEQWSKRRNGKRLPKYNKDSVIDVSF